MEKIQWNQNRINYQKIQSNLYLEVIFGKKKKWPYKTGDLLKEVQFIWNFLSQDKKGWPLNAGYCFTEMTTWVGLTVVPHFFLSLVGTIFFLLLVGTIFFLLLVGTIFFRHLNTHITSNKMKKINTILSEHLSLI